MYRYNNLYIQLHYISINIRIGSVIQLSKKKIFVICFVFYGYHILLFALIRSFTDIQNFWIESKWITDQIKLADNLPIPIYSD